MSLLDRVERGKRIFSTGLASEARLFKVYSGLPPRPSVLPLFRARTDPHFSDTDDPYERQRGVGLMSTSGSLPLSGTPSTGVRTKRRTGVLRELTFKSDSNFG